MYWSFAANDCSDAVGMRATFVSYLRARAVPGCDLMAAEIAFGELVGNVVRHAPGPIAIEVNWTGPYPVLVVTDRGRGFDPRTTQADVMDESGRGLFLVKALAGEPIVEYRPGIGCRVSVTLRVPRIDDSSSLAVA